LLTSKSDGHCQMFQSKSSMNSVKKLNGTKNLNQIVTDMDAVVNACIRKIIHSLKYMYIYTQIHLNIKCNIMIEENN
jgi:hypothetical protein